MKRCILFLILLTTCQLHAQNDSTFTYQGELKQDGVLANGEFDMVFSVWDSDFGGTQVSPTLFRFDTPVTEGRFTVDLDFGAEVFDNNERWLQIRIGVTTLSPRVPFTRAPYSIATRGIQVTEDGRVGIGVTNPPSNISLAVAAGANTHAIQAISVNNTEPTFFAFNVGTGPAINARGSSDASLGGGGLIIAGLVQSQNLSIDANEIMARNNGSSSELHLNREGGDVVIGAASAGTATLSTPVLQITGGSDLSEMFDIAGTEIQPGMVVVIDPKNPGRLALATNAYDRKVAGIVSGAGSVSTGMTMGQKGTIADGSYPVALTGRVYCLVDASQGPVEPGDLLTTSATTGHAMKVEDHQKATGAIIGKAMTSLEQGQQGLVLVLVNLQ